MEPAVDLSEQDYDEHDPLPDEEGETRGDEPFSLNLNAPNLVEQMRAHPLGIELENEITAKVCVEYDSAKQSMEPYLKGVASDLAIFYGQPPEKLPPFDKMSNMNVPIALENITRLVNRAHGELFGDWTTFYGVLPMSAKTRKEADLLSRHGNWQLTQKIPDFKRQQSRGLLLYFGVGDVTFESSFSQQYDCNRHEALVPEEYYTPYMMCSVMPDWSDVPYRGRVYDYHKHELEAFVGIWYQPALDKLLARDAPAEGEGDEHGNPLRDKIADIHGEDMPTDGPSPFRILRHETWHKMPGQATRRLFRFTVDLSTRTLLHASLHEMPSWEGLARHQMQTEQYNSYVRAQASYLQMVGDPNPQMQMQAEMLGPPQPPTWMNGPDDRPKEPEMVPINQFTHGVCIEPLRGSRGMGFGRQLADTNRMANSALNHHQDSSTLANYPAFFVATDAALPRIVVGAGEVNHVQLDANQSVDDVVKAIPLARDSGTMLELVRYADDRAREGTHASNVLSGEPGKSGESATGLIARIGEATKNIAVPTRGYADQVLVPVLKQNARLNAIFMPEDEVFLTNDEDGNPQLMQAGRSLYQRIPYSVKLRSDLEFRSDTERLQIAGQVMTMALQDPTLGANIPFGYEARRRQLEALGQADMIPLMGQPPQGPPPPFGAVQMPPPGGPPGNPGSLPSGRPGPSGPPGGVQPGPPPDSGPPPPDRPPPEAPPVRDAPPPEAG